MSRLYWQSEHRTAELLGSEKAWLSHVARGPAVTAWDLDPGHDRLERVTEILGLVAGDHYILEMLAPAQDERAAHRAAWDNLPPGQRFASRQFDPGPEHRLIRALSTALAVGGLELNVAGVRLETLSVDLNTALVAGSDPIRFAAKVAGWCESNCWIEGPDRKWAASIIDEGLRAGIYRRGIWVTDQPEGRRDTYVDQGWGDVLDLLLEADDGPVVLSYSVTDGFPDAELAGFDPNGEEFYDLTEDQQFRLSMAGLRGRRPWGRLAPGTLADVTFHLPISVYDLLAPDRDDRVRAAANQETTHA